jgi:hypothetical protein
MALFSIRLSNPPRCLCSLSHVPCRTDRTIGLAQDERPSMVCAPIMCNHWRRSFRRSQLAQPERQEQIDPPGAETCYYRKKHSPPEHNNNNNKKRDISSGYEKKMKNPPQKKEYIDPSHKIPLTIISSYKRTPSISLRFFAFLQCLPFLGYCALTSNYVS